MNKMLKSLFFMVLTLSSFICNGAITVTYGSAGETSGLLSTQISINAPSGTQSGDVLIAQLAIPGSHVTANTFAAPSGWTLISTASGTTGADIQQYIYYKNLSAKAEDSYTWTVWDWDYRSTGVIYAIRGAKALDCGSANTTNCAGNRQPTSGQAGGSTITAPNIHSSFGIGSLRMAFFADADGSTQIAPKFENGATAGRYNRAGADDKGIGIHGSYFIISSTDLANGGTQSADLNHSEYNIGSTLVIAAAATPIDHIRLEITGTPLTCTPSTLTVKACADSTCSALASSATTVALTASNGATLGNSSLAVTGSATTTLSKTTSSTATTLTANGGASNATRCFLNGTEVSNCAYSFADAGLVLTVSSPPLRAGVTSGFSVQAVKKSDTSVSCAPAFVGSRAIKFWSNYTNPSSGTKTATLNGTAIPMNSLSETGGDSTTGSSIALTFDATGTATLTTANGLNYADAGQVTLNARYDGSSTNSDSGLVMTGSTAFVSTPYALCVDSTDSNWNCNVTTALAQFPANCSAYKQAGAAFNLRVSGRAYQASTATCSLPITPNYQQSGIALTANLIAPTGGITGALSPATINITSGGTATQSTQAYSEVGVTTFTATPATGGYFSQTVPAGTSANFGRFIPAGFTLTSGALIDRRAINTGATETCSSPFTYLGEGVGLGFTLNAVNRSGTITSNYRGSFARLGLVPSTASGPLFFGAQDGTTLLNSRTTTTCTGTSGVCGTWGNGVAAIAATATVARATAQDGPFTAAKFGVKASDADGVTFQSPDYNWSLSGSNDGKLIGSTILRYGRMRMNNAYGSALLPLPITTLAQYWNGSAFVTNTDDSCTPLSAPIVSSSAIDTVLCSGGIKLYGNLSSVTATVNNPVKSGVAGLKLAKPSYTNTSNLYLDLALYVPDYLKYDWNGLNQNPSTCAVASAGDGDDDKNDDNPRARIRFGAKTNNSIIYLREIY